jgi:2,4-dienoyl-CoA reductase-like NADH-dependent reductase (Old Yellow Enzyme family)
VSGSNICLILGGLHADHSFLFLANEILEDGKADVIMLARELLRNADFVFRAAMGESPVLLKGRVTLLPS